MGVSGLRTPCLEAFHWSVVRGECGEGRRFGRFRSRGVLPGSGGGGVFAGHGGGGPWPGGGGWRRRFRRRVCHLRRGPAGREGQEDGGPLEGGVFEGLPAVVVEDEGCVRFIEEGVQTEEVDFPALAVWTARGDQREPIAPSPEFGEGFRDVGKGGDGLDFTAVVGLKGALLYVRGEGNSAGRFPGSLHPSRVRLRDGPEGGAALPRSGWGWRRPAVLQPSGGQAL